MVIVDTSTWIDHIRGLSTPLDELLRQQLVALHPFVFGELLLNGLPKSGPFSPLSFGKLAPALVARNAEMVSFIQWAKLAGQGIGYIDAHLLLSARLTDGKLLTTDRSLRAQAERFELAYSG